jgi:hypothetical protein
MFVVKRGGFSRDKSIATDKSFENYGQAAQSKSGVKPPQSKMMTGCQS